MSLRPPGYLALHASGELALRVERLRRLLDPCTLCPRRCGAHRLSGEVGVCGVGERVPVARACHHRGEEPPLSGSRGAGTIFFAGCNLGCVHCQNYQISRAPTATRGLDAEALATVMLRLEGLGVHNIELVTPSHVVPQVLAGLDLAAGRGLRLPIVYNTSAYDRVAVLRELEGVVDIYLPDLKYGEERTGLIHGDAVDYVAHSQRAVREMCRQVGRLQVDDAGVAWRGLIVRHLVLPADQSATEAVLRFIAGSLGTHTAVSLMAQYRPPPDLTLPPALRRSVLPAEYERATALLAELGLEEGWVQGLDATDAYVPDFDAEVHPFEREPNERRK